MNAFTLRGARLLAGDFAVRDLHVADGRVVASDPGGRVLDCRGMLVMPGLALGHTHLYSALATGMPGPSAPPVDFPDILRKVWWRMDRALDRDLVEISARVGAWLAVRCGVTTLIDHHASPNAIEGSLDAMAHGCAAAGLRAVLCYEITDRNGPEGRDAGLAETARFLEGSAKSRGHVRGMVGGHAPFTLDDVALRGAADLCARFDVGFHVHVSEDPTDDAAARRTYGMSPIARLDAFGLLRPDTIIGHGVHLSGWERERVAASGAWVAHNPRSNQNNHVGYARPSTQGPRVMLGTDGIGADLFAEGQAAYYAARAHDRDFDAATVQSWLDNARRYAARAFAEPLLGTLEPGAPADLVVLDDRAPTPIAAGNWPWHFVFTQSAAAVRHVFVAGEARLLDREPAALDEAALLAEAREAAERLFSRMRALPPD